MIMEEIFEPIAKELHLVKQQLSLQLRSIAEKQHVQESQKQTVDRALSHFFTTSGKGLRPALVLLSAKLVGPLKAGETSYQPLIQLATAVELIHSASLIHDDVLDNDMTAFVFQACRDVDTGDSMDKHYMDNVLRYLQSISRANTISTTTPYTNSSKY